MLREPRLARIVRRRQAVLPFPIKGGRLYLYNNNPLLRMGYRGVTGLKTGYTDAAGRCLVATARRGPIRLGVVLLHSPDPATQARQLLDRGFRAAASSLSGLNARTRVFSAARVAERKADHLRIAAGAGVEHAGGTGLERVRLRHRALPERDLAAVGLECELLGAQPRARRSWSRR